MTIETNPLLTLRHDLPDHLGVPRQADGSLAQVTVTVDAGTLQLAKVALEKLRQDLTHYSIGWVRLVLDEEQLTELTSTPDDDPVPEFALEATERLHDEFLQLPTILEFSELTGLGVTTHCATVTVTAPSVIIAVRSVLEMLEPARLALMLRDVS